MPPRSATDATRFTATGPHASAKITPSSSSRPANALPPKKTGPVGETPQQKVRRLRAAANAARDAQVSTFDKVILRGRVWADRAHRATAYTLIGITFIAGGVTVYALGDMMIYNRRKRAEFFTEQKAKHEAAVHDAKLAIDHGVATEAQLEFIAREEAEDARLAKIKEAKAKRGVFKGVTSWLFFGLKKEEEGDDVGSSEARLGFESLSEEDDALGERESDIIRAIEDKKLAIQDKAKQAFAAEKERQRTGGPLDRIGTSTENRGSGEEQPKSGGWTSFMTRR